MKKQNWKRSFVSMLVFVFMLGTLCLPAYAEGAVGGDDGATTAMAVSAAPIGSSDGAADAGVGADDGMSVDSSHNGADKAGTNSIAKGTGDSAGAQTGTDKADAQTGADKAGAQDADSALLNEEAMVMAAGAGDVAGDDATGGGAAGEDPADDAKSGLQTGADGAFLVTNEEELEKALASSGTAGGTGTAGGAGTAGGTGTAGGATVKIRIMNDMVLTKTHTISDKKVEIVGESTITAAPSLKKVFEVKDAGDLSLGGLTFDLQNKTVCVLDNSAKASFDSGVIRNGRANSRSGILYCHGANAKLELNGGTLSDLGVTSAFSGVVYVDQGGEFVMNGGTITKAAVTNQFAGPVAVNNAKMTMNGGEISNCSTDSIQSSSGIMVVGLQNNATAATAKYSEVVMNGGKICGNTGWRGGGVYVMGGNPTYADFFSTAKFILNNGTICHNKVAPVANLESGGGAVYVEYGGGMVMNGGLIEENTASAGCGGGVACYDGFVSFFGKVPYSRASGGYNGQLYKNWDKFYKASFEMNGGTIRKNHASTKVVSGDRGCGGGVYIASNNVAVKAGVIESNTAERQGGGVYVGSIPYTLRLYDALVTGNSATYMGGGVWCCPTGTIENAINNGGAVINNHADRAGDDVVTVRNSTNSSATVADRILGGGRVSWYQDGAVTPDGVLGGVDASVARYESPETGTLYIPKNRDKDSLSLKAVVTGDAAAQAAATAKVFIRNNTSMRGGGIGTNGAIVLGKSYESPIEVRVRKQFENPNAVHPEPPKPEKITVNLLANDRVVDSMELSAGNDWQGKFENLPSQKGITYRVEEEPVEGWVASYEGKEDYLGDYDFTITNRPEEPKIAEAYVSLRGKKYLDGETPSQKYTFELYDANGQLLQSVQNDGESIRFDRMTFRESGTYKYYVIEKKGSDEGITYDSARYDVTVTLDEEMEEVVTITKDGAPVDEIVFKNTTKPPVPPTPEEPPKPGEPPAPPTPKTPGMPNTGDAGAGLSGLLLVGALLGLAMVSRRRAKQH